jgi:hypothetical protein
MDLPMSDMILITPRNGDALAWADRSVAVSKSRADRVDLRMDASLWSQ